MKPNGFTLKRKEKERKKIGLILLKTYYFNKGIV